MYLRTVCTGIVLLAPCTFYCICRESGSIRYGTCTFVCKHGKWYCKPGCLSVSVQASQPLSDRQSRCLPCACSATVQYVRATTLLKGRLQKCNIISCWQQTCWLKGSSSENYYSRQLLPVFINFFLTFSNSTSKYSNKSLYLNACKYDFNNKSTSLQGVSRGEIET